MKTVIEMACEAGFASAEFWPEDFKGLHGCVKRFAELVRADERDRAMRENAYVLAEREACAKVCEGYCGPDYDTVSDILAAQIRARGNT